MFPKDFVWGVASSAYQVEGTDAKDGRGKNIWDEFARSGRVYEHQTAEVCCDHMHRYREDFALMRMLGIKKLSIFHQLVADSSGGNREGQRESCADVS